MIFFEEFETRQEAKQKIFEWIEVFYNRERLHSTLGYKSPEKFEMEYFKRLFAEFWGGFDGVFILRWLAAESFKGFDYHS